MLSFEFKLLDASPISTLSLGLFTLHSQDYTVTSRSAGMVFLYVPVLLDNLRLLLQNPYQRSCELSFPASSFGFILQWNHKKPQNIILSHGRKISHEYKTEYVVDVFRSQVSKFVYSYIDNMTVDEEGAQLDMLNAIRDFEQFTYP